VVLNRDLKKPDDKTWTQAWVPTHHQNKFISVADTKGSFTVMNKGLPEYEVRPESDGNVTMLITLLRCIGWLSRADMASRKGNAGPALRTPTAQCLGVTSFELAITTAEKDWLNSNTNHIAEQYIAPLQPMIPQSVGIQFRMWDTLTLFMGMMMKNVNYTPNPILPTSLGFMKLTNQKLTMTALKKAEKADAVIVRLLNLAPTVESDTIEFYAPIKEAVLVNYNEDIPKTPIKASISANGSKLTIKLDPCVLATIQLKF
jgi:alpha-mannosidase